MYLRKIDGPRVVILPDGRVITRADLPENNGMRWVAKRKRAVAEAVQSGLISRLDAMRTYELSEGELNTWCRRYPVQCAN